MLFLANMASKMNGKSALGSRIAEVHNGSSLFTGDAGQGESNIRRWLIESDWLEAIVALPLNLFYNTGIATYVWVLSNKKPAHRKGQVQLIDASQWFRPLRKNLGKKNCELSPEDIERISRTFLEFKETPESKIFPNAAFGYWKVTVERPLRLHSQLTLKAIETLRFTSGDEDIFSSETGRQLLEEQFLLAGMRIRSFCKNPSQILRPLGFSPFGLGFGSMIATFRNCPNNAPLALWWGDPDAHAGHPFRNWYPLLPRKTYAGVEGFDVVL